MSINGHIYNQMTSEQNKYQIEIDKPFDLLLRIMNNRTQYKELAFAEYIYSLLYYKSKDSIDIIKWIEDNLSENINLILQEMIQYIYQLDSDEYSFIMFDICCQLNLEQTKQYWMSRTINLFTSFIYNKIIELYEVKKELEKYQSKYESLKYYMENMSNGLLYYEMNDDYQRYMNQIR